jgi:hypothetical protein
MARYFGVTTTTVSNSSVAIGGTLTGNNTYEVLSKDAAVWVHTTGGTAAADGAGCIYIPQNGWVEITLDDAQTSLTAIRADSTDAKVVVSSVQP